LLAIQLALQITKDDKSYLLFFEKSLKQLDECFSNTKQLPHVRDFEK